MKIAARLVPAVLVAVASFVATASGPAVAQGGPDGGSGNGSFGFSDEQGVPLGSEPPSSSASSGNGPPATYNVDFFEGVAPEEGTFENESGCWGATLAEGDGGSTWAEVQETLAEYNDAQAYGVCAAEETFDLGAYVLLSWQTVVRPPPPTPLQVDPGKALTGLTAYLEIGGDPNPTETLDNPIGPDIVITMTPRYVVSWGDGTTVKTTSQGVAYPGGAGEITHTFLEPGGVTVSVEAYWHATWTAGGFGGDLPELAAPTTADLDLPVEQRQAVIDAG